MVPFVCTGIIGVKKQASLHIMKGDVRGEEPVSKETIDSVSYAKCNNDRKICVGPRYKMQRIDSGEREYPNNTNTLDGASNIRNSSPFPGFRQWGEY